MDVALVSYFYPTVTFGGASRHTYNLSKALSKHVKVTLYIPSILPKLQSENPKIKGCGFIKQRGLALPSFAISASLALDEHDIVHSMAGSGIFLKRIDVETFHHLDTVGFLPTIYYLEQRICLKRAKHIICVSEASKKDLLRIGLTSAKVSVIWNGIDTSVFKRVDGNLIRRRFGLEGKRVCLYVGDLGKRKNIGLLLKMLKATPEDCYLLIVTGKANKQQIERIAHRYGLEKSIIVSTNVSDVELPYYYSAADLFVLPSLIEGFGLVLLEAVAVGCPFVAMKVGIAPFLARSGFGVTVNDEESFIKECLKYLNNPIKLDDKSYEFVQQNFSWDIVAQRTLEIYNKILEA